MSLNPVVENSAVAAAPTGARRMTLAMLEARTRADLFPGVQTGKAKPLTFLFAFQAALPYLGLPPHTFELVSWLVSMTMAHDWEVGSRPICWPSAQRQQEHLRLSEARVKVLNNILFEANIFVMRDSEQGKRYGRRGPDKRIVEGYGFDLTPLAQRYDEFIRIAAEAKIERDAIKIQRKRITIAHRAIRQASDLLVSLGLPLLTSWLDLMKEAAELATMARKKKTFADLEIIALQVESRQIQAEQWLKDESKPVETSPSGLADNPHSTTTNESINLIDTVMAADSSSCAEDKTQPIVPATPARPKPRRALLGFQNAAQLVDLFPRVGQYIREPNPDWLDFANAAGVHLRNELGISQMLWNKACQIMGCEGAALSIAIVSTKPDSHFKKDAASYYGGMIKLAEQGKLYLEKSLWAIREAKWGKPDPKRKLN